MCGIYVRGCVESHNIEPHPFTDWVVPPMQSEKLASYCRNILQKNPTAKDLLYETTYIYM